MKPDLCIFHGPGCLDGFTAAWAIWKRWPDIEFVAAQYGDTSPDVAGKHVLICDFSYKYDVLVAMAASAKSITVLDHHQSAQVDLAAFNRNVDRGHHLLATPLVSGAGLAAWATLQPDLLPVQAWFDMDKSGARLAWEYAFPDEAAPQIVLSVEDRDLWRFLLHGTREINAVLASCEPLFDVWDNAAWGINRPDQFDRMLEQGSAILRAQMKDMKALIAAGRTERVIAGHLVPVVNAPPMWASEIGNILAPGQPFAATYYDTAGGHRSFSLRSAPGGADVSAIAAQFGGGGHKHAAGFKVPLDAFTWEPV